MRVALLCKRSGVRRFHGFHDKSDYRNRGAIIEDRELANWYAIDMMNDIYERQRWQRRWGAGGKWDHRDEFWGRSRDALWACVPLLACPLPPLLFVANLRCIVVRSDNGIHSYEYDTSSSDSGRSGSRGRLSSGSSGGGGDWGGGGGGGSDFGGGSSGGGGASASF